MEPAKNKSLFDNMNILALDTDEKGNLWIGGIQHNNGRLP